MNRICFALFWIAVALGCSSWLVHASEPQMVFQQGENRPDDIEPAPHLALWPTQVRGIGTDIDRAKKNAFEEARLAVVKYLHSQDPPLKHWKPNQQKLAELLIDAGEAGPDAKLLPGADAMKTWILRFEPLDAKTHRRFERLDAQAKRIHELQQRQQRIEQRTILTGKIFFICLLVLIGCFAYARVQQCSNRFIVRCLPVALIGGVICMMAGLWFF